MNERKIAFIRISSELLRDTLCLPPETLIVGVDKSEALGEIRLIVEHPDLKPVQEGHHLPEAAPQIRKVFAVPERNEFQNWGQ